MWVPWGWAHGCMGRTSPKPCSEPPARARLPATVPDTQILSPTLNSRREKAGKEPEHVLEGAWQFVMLTEGGSAQGMCRRGLKSKEFTGPLLLSC